MKKIFTTLALGVLGFAGLNAQIFTVTVDGNEVKNGETVTSNTVEAVEFEGELFMWELKPKMLVNLNADATVIMTVTNDSETLPLNDCGLGNGSCQAIQPGKSLETPHNLSAGTVDARIYYTHTDLANLPTDLNLPCTVKLQAETDSEEQEMEFKMVLVYPGEGSVNGIAGDTTAFTVADGAVLASDGSAVEVYTLSGVRVANEDLNGLYIVRAAGKTAKLVVK